VSVVVAAVTQLIGVAVRMPYRCSTALLCAFLLQLGTPCSVTSLSIQGRAKPDELRAAQERLMR